MVSISADQQSPLVMAANAAYRTPGSSPSITFPFTGLSNGKMTVEVTDMEFSDDVAAGQVTVENASTPLTPSQRWLSFTRDLASIPRTISLIRLDVQGENNHATWLLPTGEELLSDKQTVTSSNCIQPKRSASQKHRQRCVK